MLQLNRSIEKLECRRLLAVDSGIFAPSAAGEGETTLPSIYFDSEAAFDNEAGFFLAEADGSVNGILPGEAGYAAAALTSDAQEVLYARGAAIGSIASPVVPSESDLVFYIIQNSTTEDFLERNPDNTPDAVDGQGNSLPVAFFTLPEANPDGVDHALVAELPGDVMEFRWEDLTGLGVGGDFNDVIFPVNVQESGEDDGEEEGDLSIYISSGDTDSILAYDAEDGEFQGVFAEDAALDEPEGLVFGPNGNLFVTSRTNEVLEFDGETGDLVGVFASGNGLFDPAGLAFGGPDNDLFVGSGDPEEGGESQILRFDGVTGDFETVVDAGNTGELNNPEGLIFGPDGLLYVNSAGDGQVLRYDAATNAFVDVFVAEEDNGGISDPVDLTFGPDGNLYVSSAETSEVMRFDGATGAFIDIFVPAGRGGLVEGEGVIFAPDGDLLVVSEGGDSVLRYESGAGAFAGAMVNEGSGGLAEPTFLTLGPSAEEEEDGEEEDEEFYAAMLTTLNGSAVSGVAYIESEGDELTVTIFAVGLEPDQAHPQHIFGRFEGDPLTTVPQDSVVPPPEADTDGDGFIEVLEGTPFYGSAILPLTSVPIDDNESEIEPLFQTGAGGKIRFSGLYDLSDESQFFDPFDELDFDGDDVLPLDLRVIALHGLSVAPGAGSGTDGEVDGSGGYLDTLPIAAGEIFSTTEIPG